MLTNSPSQYGLISKSLHWLIALSIIGLTWLGWWMVGLDYYSTWYHRAPELHKSIGLAVLLAAALQILWHRTSPPPHLQKELKSWEKAAARTVHVVLVLAMFLLPITGYLIATSAGHDVSFFGLVDVPALTGKSERLRDLAIALHYYASYGLLAIVAMHAGAALKHQIIDGHGTLRRML